MVRVPCADENSSPEIQALAIDSEAAHALAGKGLK